MTAPLWAGIVLLIFGALALGLVRPPRRLPVRLTPERVAAVLVLLVAAGLAVLRAFAVAIPLAAIGLGLWRQGRATAPTPGQRSEVRSPGLAMVLDHDSGTMDGTVLTGALAGRTLAGLGDADLWHLRAEFSAAGDQDSLALLLAWMDRVGREAAAPEAPAGAGGGAMSEAEALRVLGLAPGAGRDEVRAAYRRLIRRVHPDLGGSAVLAAMLNAARQVLDPDG